MAPTQRTTNALSLILALFLMGLPLLSAAAQGEDEPVRLYTKTLKKGGYIFYADNLRFYPVQITINFTTLRNMAADTTLPLHTVLRPSVKAFRLLTIKPRGSGSYGYRLTYMTAPGDPSLKPDKTHAYLLPFAHGAKYKVTQGYFGKYSHNFTDRQYALDFAMKTGTPVHAARDGIVVRVKQDSNIGGPGRAYAKHGNYILVMHKDGTFARYLHLKLNGSVVKPGEKVDQGQHIGYSGNTGWSLNPHLHFEVERPTKGKLISMPTLFRINGSSVTNLTAGLYYYGYQPGGQPYTQRFGRDLTDKDFAGYRKTVPKTGNVEIVTKKLDDTTMCFIKNGLNSKLEMTVNFTRFVNMTCSKPLPHKVDVPPLSEIYLFLIRPRDPSREWEYSISSRYRY